MEYKGYANLAEVHERLTLLEEHKKMFTYRALPVPVVPPDNNQ